MHPMQPLDIFSYLGKLQDYYARERIIPSTTQLSVLWNVKARSWTHQIVQRLKEEGFLENAAGGRLRPGPRFFERTVGHAVRAGLPQQAADVQPELLRIDDYLIEKPSQTILFPVKGDSMVDLGILEGDMVIIERSNSASPGQVVLAIVDNEFTLKVLARDKEGYYLEARNEKRSQDYPPIRPEQELEIYGFYVGLFRKASVSGHPPRLPTGNDGILCHANACFPIPYPLAHRRYRFCKSKPDSRAGYGEATHWDFPPIPLFPVALMNWIKNCPEGDGLPAT